MTYRAGVSGCQYPGQLQYRVVNPRGAGVFFDKAFSQPLGVAALHPGALVCGTPRTDPSGMSSYVVEVGNGYMNALDLDQLTSASPLPVLAHATGFEDEYVGCEDEEYVGGYGMDPIGAFRAGYEAALGYGMDPVGAFRAGVGPCQFPGQLQYRVVSPHGASVFFDKAFSQPLSVPALHPGALVCGTPKMDPSGMSSYVVEVDNGYVSALDLQQLTSAAPSPVLRGYFTGADPHLEEERRRAEHRHEEHREHHEEHRKEREEHRDHGGHGAHGRCMSKAKHAGVDVFAAMLNPFAAIAASQGIKECHEEHGHRVGYSNYRSGFSDYAGYHVGAAAAAHEHGAAASTAPPAAQAAIHAQNAQAQAQSAHAAAAHPTADKTAASKAAHTATSHAQKAQDHAHAASTAQHPAAAAHHANQAAMHAHAAAAHARGAHAEMHGARAQTPTGRGEREHARAEHGRGLGGRGGHGFGGHGFARHGMEHGRGRGRFARPGFERGFGRFGRHGFSRGWGRGYGRAWRSWSGHEWGWAHPEWRFYGHPAWRSIREDLMGYSAECALRNDWGICLKEIITTPGGVTTYRITPAGVQEDIELEQDEQWANDTAASQGETVVGTDDGLVQGSEQESDGSNSPPEKDAADQGDAGDAASASADQGADQGDAGNDASASADDGGDAVDDTTAKGDFAGWQDPFTDPYGYMNPYMPSAWDSHYMYHPYYYEHPYHWPTPHTGPYPYPSPYHEGPHPHVGNGSAPVMAGWDGWHHHHHEEYPGYGFGGWGWGHGF
jgi:hypothetical protein